MDVALINDIVINEEEINNDTDNRWNEFIDHIMSGNVIPIIGPDFQIQDKKNVHSLLIDYFVNRYNVKSNPISFSQLIYDKDFIYHNKKQDIIYPLVDKILKQINFTPADILMKLMETKMFPFVITTSFTSVVEKAMYNVWGKENVRVLKFVNDPQKDMKIGEGDVMSEKDLTIPTVYYMFGKHCPEYHKYVLTDMDMINFCKSWMMGQPPILNQIIRKKYLLFLGNNYSDWLFRFIWYSMRQKDETMRFSLLTENHPEQSLVDFMQRLDAFIQANPEEAVRELIKRLNDRKKNEQEKSNSHQREYGYDVFISYSRSDQSIADEIYNSLSKRGLRVWYDKNTINPGTDWKNSILQGIRNSRLFLPILTSNIENEVMKPHEYRIEWKEAVNEANKIGGVKFIIPLAEKGFDFYNERTDIPNEFKAKNSLMFVNNGNFDALADAILESVNEIKNMETRYK